MELLKALPWYFQAVVIAFPSLLFLYGLYLVARNGWKLPIHPEPPENVSFLPGIERRKPLC